MRRGIFGSSLVSSGRLKKALPGALALTALTRSTSTFAVATIVSATLLIASARFTSIGLSGSFSISSVSKRWSLRSLILFLAIESPCDLRFDRAVQLNDFCQLARHPLPHGIATREEI